MKIEYLLQIVAFFMLVSCSAKKEQQEVTPWGTAIGEETNTTTESGKSGGALSLDDIVSNGELIMLTVNGPSTYYEYHGRGMGLYYLLCEKFAQHIGVSLRVEVCKDTTEMVNKLAKGEGDIIAVPLPHNVWSKDSRLNFCGATPDSTKTQWTVAKDNRSLADTLNAWFKPKFIAMVRQEESFLLSTRSITRHVYSPFLNRSKGVISKYDRLFQMYAPTARMDWRLMAAQCYQESCFDPNAKSWAGAQGLMQIMPATAAHFGLPQNMVHDPEANVAAAAKYMAELQGMLTDIGDPSQRICYALAAYNGGLSHIRDAMALAKKHGKNPHNWSEASQFVLLLSQPAYYTDPVVKHGYMRGSETVDYVQRIRSRWSDYSGGVSGRMVSGASISGSSFHAAPVKAKRKYSGKYHL